LRHARPRRVEFAPHHTDLGIGGKRRFDEITDRRYTVGIRLRMLCLTVSLRRR
jgi:hypothetical protein